MVHRITRQYIMKNCGDKDDILSVKSFILELIKAHLSIYCHVTFVDARTDMYLYDLQYFYYPDAIHKIEKAYVFKDTISGMYLYFFYMTHRSSTGSSALDCGIYFTLSKKYDSSKNILEQEGAPKVFGRTKSGAKAGVNWSDVNTHAYECYGFLLSICLQFTYAGDFYFITNTRDFSIVIDQSYRGLGRYGNEVASYFIYDTSSAYHTVDKRVVSIHGTNSYHFRTGCSQKLVVADIAEYSYEWLFLVDPNHNTNYSCLLFVPCDTFDTGISGYYSTDFTKLSTKHMTRSVKNLYVCDSKSLLHETKEPNLSSPYQLSRKECSTGIPHDYEEPDIQNMFVGAMVSYFDGYALRRQFQTPTAAEIMYRTSGDFNYLDTNSGTNYYSGMLSTLNSSTVAIPNFVSVLREPVELGTMSPVQESTFMYLVDMSKIQTGEVVEVVDNKGNKIRLVCFPTSMKEIVPPGDKLFGVGFRLEDTIQTENYLDIENMEKSSGKSIMTLLNAKNRISAYLGDVDFKDYQTGVILLKHSYRNVESIEISYTDMDGDYVQKISWTAHDFIDRMGSGEDFDLLRSNNNGDYWYVDPRKSTEIVLVSGLKNCGIVSISCNRRK